MSVCLLKFKILITSCQKAESDIVLTLPVSLWVYAFHRITKTFIISALVVLIVSKKSGLRVLMMAQIVFDIGTQDGFEPLKITGCKLGDM